MKVGRIGCDLKQMTMNLLLCRNLIIPGKMIYEIFQYIASITTLQQIMRTTSYVSWSFFSMNFIFFLVERRPRDLFIREQKAIFSLVERGLISVLQQRRLREDSIINLKLCQDLDKQPLYRIFYWFIVFEVLVKVRYSNGKLHNHR